VAVGKRKPISKQRVSQRGLAERLSLALPKNSIRRVAVVFVLILAVLLPISMFSAGWSGWAPVTGAIAAIAGACARFVGLPAVVSGSNIVMPTRTLAVDPQCTAVDLFVVYAALVLAYPLKWKMRLAALAAGAVVLQVFNVLRLIGVAWAAEALNGMQFNLVHDYLFEFGMVFVVMMMWAVWLSLASRQTA